MSLMDRKVESGKYNSIVLSDLKLTAKALTLKQIED